MTVRGRKVFELNKERGEEGKEDVVERGGGGGVKEEEGVSNCLRG